MRNTFPGFKNFLPRRLGAVVFGLVVGILPGRALEVAGVFGDNMVMARDKPASVWGWAEPGEDIRVAFLPEGEGVAVKATARADGEGRWKVELPPQKGGAKGAVEIVSSKGGSLRLANVAFGEVWFCSGQSNMYLQLWQALDGQATIASAGDPDLRLVQVKGSSAVPLDRDKVQWKVCEPKSVKNFSALAYSFGRKLREELGVPVGLIQSACNATSIQCWMPMDLLERLPESKDLAEAHQKKIALMGAQPDAATIEALPKGERSLAPGGYRSPAALYNAMVHPWVGYPLSGFLWYQGESNAREAEAYRVLFPAFVTELRRRWQQGDLPFAYVELAGYKAPPTAPVEENNWSDLREAQRAVLQLPKTAAATAIDVGDEKDIHPRDKKTVGERLAQAVLWQMSDGKAGGLSPQLERAEFTGSEVVLHVSHAGEGLRTKDGAAPAMFAVRGSEGPWKSASVRLEADKIVVEAGEGSEPREVRYAWAMNPSAMNVVNSGGLPLLPFRIAKP